MAVYHTINGDMLDAICAQHYPQEPLDRAVDVVLAANTHLVGQPPQLPQGLAIELPVIPAEATRPSIQLWD